MIIVLKLQRKGDKTVRYIKPTLKKVVLKLTVATNASEQSSCYGGHCVEQDTNKTIKLMFL